MKQKLIALFLIIVMVASALTAVGLTTTTTVAAATTTTTTLTALPASPAVNQQVTFTVTLKSGSTGLSKEVKIWHTLNGKRYDDVTLNTVNGVDSFIQAFSTTGQRIYHAEFAGDSSYGASSGTVTVTVLKASTTTTLTALPASPAVNQQVTFTVTLGGPYGLLKEVKIWHTLNGKRYDDGTHTTLKGVYSFIQAFSTSGQRIYHAEFAGDSQFKASSGTVTVDVGTKTTTATITASKTNPAVNIPVSFTVNLKFASTGLSKPVKIWHTLSGVRYEDGTHNTVNGVYSFTQAFGSKGQHIYHAEFAGDNQYGASSGTVTVDVGTKTTTTTITASKTNPAVNDNVIFTVTLKEGNTGLSKPVKVWYSSNGVRREWTFNTVNGILKFGVKFDSNGQVIYHAEFAGDSQYGPSSGTVTVIVKYGTTLSPTSAVTSSVLVGEKYTLSGYLKDQNGNPLAGQKIQFYYRKSTLLPWQAGSSVYTTSTGSYSDYGLAASLTTYQYQARYAGDDTHWGASSAIWTVTWI